MLLQLFFLLLFLFSRAMQNICRLNVNTVLDYLSIKDQGTAIQNYILVIDDIDVHIVRQHSQEGELPLFK